MIKSRRPGQIMLFLVLLTLVLSAAIKVAYVWGNNTAFTPDQGRDLVDIRQMVVSHTPRLVGPTTSINGVLLGPFYYYFITIPILLFGGSPMAVVIWQIIWFQLACLYIWFVLRKKEEILAGLVSIFLLLSPVGFYTGRYFWNANAMPIFTIFFFGCLVNTLWRRQGPAHLFILGLVAGISLHIEAAFGLLFFPFGLIVLLTKKFSLKDIAKYCLAFAATLLPQAIFELRHGFLMTKTLIAGLSGASADLGEKLLWSVRLVERQSTLRVALMQSNHVSFEILGPVLIAAFIFGLYFLYYKKKATPSSDLFSLSFWFMAFAMIFYLIFPQHLKSWYTYGLSIPAVFILAAFFTNLSSLSRFGLFCLWVFTLLTVYHALTAHLKYLSEYLSVPSKDPSNLALELRIVDQVYVEADGQPFKVYNYLPSVYDYTYQYLFWWHGTKKYGYQPSDIAYLPGQPEYIKDNARYWTKKKQFQENSPTFLIIQGDGDHQERLYAWGGNFTSLCLEKTIELTDSLTIKKLLPCGKGSKAGL